MNDLKEVKEYLSLLGDVEDQERELLFILSSGDINALSDFLSGKGNDKESMIMSANSENLMEAWINRLNHDDGDDSSSSSANSASSGDEDDSVDIFGSGVLGGRSDNQHGDTNDFRKAKMKGMLLKMSRGANATTLPNWKERFFVLENNTLTYYQVLKDRNKKIKKGSMVVCGAERLMPKVVADGNKTPRASSIVSLTLDTSLSNRPHSFKVRKGRDLSIVDQMLIREAEKQLRQLQTNSYEKILITGVNNRDMKTLQLAIDKIDELALNIKSDLYEEARGENSNPIYYSIIIINVEK